MLERLSDLQARPDVSVVDVPGTSDLLSTRSADRLPVMNSSAALVIGVVLLAVLIVVVAVLTVSRNRGRQAPESPVYVVNDAVDFTVAALEADTLDRVGKTGVRRIIEWSTHYLQGLAIPAHQRKGLVVVAGGEERAIEYIHRELARRGYEYSPGDIAAVLAGEAGYLAGIGALGERVKEQEPV